jgi:glycosyltransferase involved in cell wall biosynthesis
MKILFLSKRCPQAKDLLTRPYGRFFHIPRLFAERGHEVHILLLSYHNQPIVNAKKFGIQWHARSIMHLGKSSYWSTACALANTLKPDWVVGFSDTYYGILAEHLGRKFGINSAIDAYDNYESYLPWCTPLHFFWRRAVSQATAVTAAGPQLAELLQQSRPGRPVFIVPMAADVPDFISLDQEVCRRELNLPLENKMIGYCGSIYRNRGMKTLFDAHEILKDMGCDIDLVLTGRKEKGISLPSSVKWLGYLDDDKIPVFMNSLDVATIINRVSRFGKYSYPVKLYEAMRCQIPVIATDTPSVNWILKGDDRFLARPDDPYDLAEKICKASGLGRVDYGEQTSWEQSCKAFENVLLQIN